MTEQLEETVGSKQTPDEAAKVDVPTEEDNFNSVIVPDKEPEKDVQEDTQEEKSSEEAPSSEQPEKGEAETQDEEEEKDDETDPEKSPLSEQGVNLWLDGTTLLVEISIFLNEAGKLMLVTLLNVEETLKELNMVRKPVLGEFTIPDLPALEKYRTRAERWSQSGQQFTTDRGRIRRLLLRHHLQKLTVAGEVVKLKHDEQGVLTLESEKKVDKLHPSVTEVLMLKFEREAALV